MFFLLKSDLYAQIDAPSLSIITGGDDLLLTQAILHAQSEVASYLRQRYDTAFELRPVTGIWSGGATSAFNERWQYDPAGGASYAIYVVKATTTTNPPTDTTDWSAGDDRNPLLVSYAIDCALYFLFSRINPRQVPELRIKRYDDAKAWLIDVSNGNIDPALKVIASDDPGGRIRWGSAGQQVMSY